MSNSFNPLRLDLARRRRMLTKKALAEAVGVSRQAVALWDSGIVPSELNLMELERVLAYPKQFFFGDDLEIPVAGVVSFRSQSAMTAASRDAALAAGSLGFLVADWVAYRFNLPPTNLPDLHLYASDPETASRVLREEWKLGELPISNMISLLESKGVRVFSLCENTRTVNAYSLWRHGIPFIYLNNFKSAECSRFDAAHELAHLILHQDGGVIGRQAEEQAHRFASAFLMPESDVRAQMRTTFYLNKLVEAKKRWKVSLAALVYRLRKLGLTSEWKNRDFCIEIAKRGWNSDEPNSMPRERSTVWEKVLKSLWCERLTHVDLAQDLNLPVREVADLLFGVLQPSEAEFPSVSLSLVEPSRPA